MFTEVDPYWFILYLHMNYKGECTPSKCICIVLFVIMYDALVVSLHCIIFLFTHMFLLCKPFFLFPNIRNMTRISELNTMPWKCLLRLIDFLLSDNEDQLETWSIQNRYDKWMPMRRKPIRVTRFVLNPASWLLLCITQPTDIKECYKHPTVRV